MGKGTEEAIKLGAVLLFFSSFVVMFINLQVGLVMFIVAGVLTGYRLMKGASEREARRASAVRAHETTVSVNESTSLGSKPAADRLRELAAMHADGLITDGEFEVRRRAIHDDV